MSDPHPFLFFDHGHLEVDRVGKCEEVFIWFARAPTPSERKHIVATCPEPLRSFQWGDRFAYFGSPGDMYDGLIADTYGSDAFKAATEANMKAIDEGRFDDLDEAATNVWTELFEAVPKFAAALDAWAMAVHERVPIVFLKGPHGTDPDDWGVYSEAEAGRAMQAMRDYEAANPWVLDAATAGDEPVEPAPESGRKRAPRVHKYQVMPLPRSTVAEFYGWMKADISRRLPATGAPDPQPSIPSTSNNPLPPDADTACAQSAERVRSGDVAGAHDLLVTYISAGRPLDWGVLNNLCYTLRNLHLDAGARATATTLVRRALEADPTLLRSSRLMEVVLAVMNENGAAAESIDLVATARDAGLQWTPGVLCNTVYSGVRSTDRAVATRVAEWLEAALRADKTLGKTNRVIHDNAACLYCFLGDIDLALRHFKKFKGRRKLSIDPYRADPDYALLMTDDRFLALFVPKKGR